MAKKTYNQRSKKKKTSDIICPRCGDICDTIISSRGYDWCVHQDGKDSNGNYIYRRHSLGPSNGEYKIYNNRGDEDDYNNNGSLLEKKNIKLRSLKDKNRFKKYIDDSLNLDKEQDDFDEKEVNEILDIINKWLQGLKNDKEYKKIINQKITEIKQEIQKSPIIKSGNKNSVKSQDTTK